MASMVVCFEFVVWFFAPVTSQAEQCWQISGCEGNVGWFRVNKYLSYDYALESQSLFGSNELPQVNSVVVITREAYLRNIFWEQPEVVGCHDVEYKNRTPIDPECKVEIQLSNLPAGTKVRVLAYHQGHHLFALVRIISHPRWGSDEQQKALKNSQYLNKNKERI